MIEYSYSDCSISYNGPTNRGFLGFATLPGILIGNRFDVDESNQTSDAAGVPGYSTINMKTESSYTSANWDFERI